jgi:hypothetical protein
MDKHQLSLLVMSCILMIFGLWYMHIPKDKLKGQKIKDKDKKGFFIYGIISMSIGFLIFLFFIIITFG